MKIDKRILALGLFLLGLALASVSVSAYSNPSNNWQAQQPSFDKLYSSGDVANYWPILKDMNTEQCEATSDFVIGILPGGCSPSVVRSDLLAEQNVPVFCQLHAIKVNPLIKVSSVKSIAFKGDYPEGVRSVVFHPARAAVKSYSTLLGDPLINNIGYVVIILEREKVEANMEEWIAGNLTATIKYDAEEAYGTGRGEYYLPDMSEAEWDGDYEASAFWNGRGFLRMESVEDGVARIQVLTSKDKVSRTFTLKEGETSDLTYLPGYYCKAGLKVKLNGFVVPEDKALLNVDGQSVWVREGTKFLDGKCSVKKLSVADNNEGSIDISCSGAGTVPTLSLSKSKILLGVDEDNIKEYGIGDVVGSKYIYYYDAVEKWEENKEFVILTSGVVSDLKTLEAVKKLMGTTADFDSFSKGVKEIAKLNGAVVLEGYTSGGGFYFEGFAKEVYEDKYNENAPVVDTYFKKAGDTTSELIDEYPSEEKETGEKFAEEALFEQIVLAGEVGKFETQSGLMDLFLDKYPLAKTVEKVRSMRQGLDGTDRSDSFTSIYVGDAFHSISVADFKSVEEGDRFVDLRVGTKKYTNYSVTEEGKEIDLLNERKLSILDISPGKVKLFFDSAKTGVSSKTVTVSEGKRVVFDGIEVVVDDVKVNEVAYVSLLPEVKNTKTEANFTFRIGVEQRLIELSPEKTRQMLKNINASIKEWQDIVDKLGTVIMGMKGACFATSAFLMIKNMATGFSGEAVARQDVMEEYRAKCAAEHSEMTKTECYNLLSGDIDKDVAALAVGLQAVNKKMEAAQEGNTADSGGLLDIGSDVVVDQKKYKEALIAELGCMGSSIDVNVDGKTISVPCKDLSVSQLRDAMLEKELKGEGGTAWEIAKKKRDDSFRNTALWAQSEAERDAISKKYEFIMEGEKKSLPVGVLTKDQDSFLDGGFRATGGELNKIVDRNLGVDENKIYGAQIVHVNSKDYLYIFDSKGAQEGVWEITGVRTYETSETISLEKKSDSLPKVEGAQVTMVSRGSCSNPWTAGTAKVSYYEAGNNQGLPAIVPFDLKDGWYVKVSNSGGTHTDNSPQGYKASADVKSFTICNIGSDKVMQNGESPDLCQGFDVNTAGVVKDFIPCPSMSSSEVSALYTRAREAIRRASDQYGKNTINIFDVMMEVGQPMSEVGGFECQDFMSPSDCKLMFNVCDPVICPPSRCDLGGKMPVADVIQTGVIGSLALCLPNAKEGIFIPICLSGVHAGLDAYLSILKSEADCLQHSLDTGEYVGICDEITAIYKCEFFWRQLSPMMNQLVPSFLASVFSPGEKVRGGGEYALTERSWNVMSKSVDYFKNTYAQNAFRAFNLRNTEEVGSTFCKAFVGTSVPTSANILENLLEPESPSQFYAQFSENPFTEATVPATSQYKVYFHIYAGKDEGAQYRVYLKNPPASSYYAQNPTVTVKQGYVAKGSSADESIDFTSPAGYKELCVVINAREECGFKSVTTDFGLNYVKNKFVEEQVEKSDITSEKDCVSGTPSALSMVNLNLQAGASEMVNPEIALRGIVRICASANPGAGVNSEGNVYCGAGSENSCGKVFSCNEKTEFCEYYEEGVGTTYQKTGSRWKDVGYCGDSSFRCWLDMDSVKDDLEAIEAIEGTTNKDLEEMRGLIENTASSLEQVRKSLVSIRAKIKALLPGDLKPDTSGYFGDKILGIEKGLDNIIGFDNIYSPDDSEGDYISAGNIGAGTNGDRAEALALKATLYRMIVGEAKKTGVVNERVRRVGVVAVAEKVEDEKVEVTPGVAAADDDIVMKGVVNLTECRGGNGDVILRVAANLAKKDREMFKDETIKTDTGAKNFECLVLQLAMQESSLTHCGIINSKGVITDCQICRKDTDDSDLYSNLIKGDGSRSYGIMQLSDKYFKEEYTLERNIIAGVNKLIAEYNTGDKMWTQDGKTYSGWDRALRGYNGWGSTGGDLDYVKGVKSQQAIIAENFPAECGIVVSVVTDVIPSSDIA